MIEQTELKVILFGEGLLVPTLTEDKKMTMRKYREGAHDFKKGEIFIGKFADGMDLLLEATEDTEKKTFADLKDEEAQADLFENAQDAIKKMKERYYPDLTLAADLAILRYQLVRILGTPVIKLTKTSLLIETPSF